MGANKISANFNDKKVQLPDVW